MQCTILACSYENIGPFADERVLVSFLQGSHLIKAPIGSGKSFLFFDGPIFGLYKSGTRPMLSRTMQQGQIQVLVEVDEECLLIKRTIKATKAGNDSVQSQLFRITDTREFVHDVIYHSNHPVLRYDMMLSDIPLHYEQIETSSQKEIDAYIANLLPPQEVILSSCILLQDSDNIFEMTPATRIQVFKELFNLLDMDVAKELLSEEKRRISLTRQVLQEDRSLELSFTKLLQSFTTLVYRINAYPLHAIQGFTERTQQPLLQDLLQLQATSVQMSGFTLSGYDPIRTQQLIAILTDALSEYNTRIGTRQQLEAQCEQLRRQHAVQLKQLQQQQEQLITIEQRIQSYDTQVIETLRNEIARHTSALALLDRGLPIQEAARYGVVFSSVSEAKTVLMQSIQDTKQWQQEYASLTTRLQDIQSQLQDIKNNKQQLELQVQVLREQRAGALFFDCDKIQGACPYVGVINKIATQGLDQQEQYIYTNMQLLTDRYTSLSDTHIVLCNQQQALEKKIAHSKEVFVALGWKQLEERFQEADRLQKQLYEYQKRLASYDTQRQEWESLQHEMIRLQTSNGVLSAQLEKDAVILGSYEEQLIGLQHNIDPDYHAILQQAQHDFQHCAQLAMQLSSLLDTHMHRQQDLMRLVARESKIKELLTVFQKELLIVVLQDFLPVLEEVINSYLVQIVGFSLQFALPKTLQEDIELNIRIDDEKGRRAVKSLSGGQKAVLRLCWILAVSSLFKQSFLLLDETINSLDQEAIARVAETLDGFVKKQQVTFFVVTHAPQIQDMHFWDSIVHLEKKLSK